MGQLSGEGCMDHQKPTLLGHAVQTLHWLSTENARKWIPPELPIVSFWPGRTLGGLFVARYSPAPGVTCSELIAFCGVVRRQEKLGLWASHVYINDFTAPVHQT